MSDPANSSTQTQTDLFRLEELIGALGEIANRQRDALLETQSPLLTQSSSEMMQLLSPVRKTLQVLKERIEAQEKERQQLRALQDIGALINSSLNQSEVLNIVMDTIINLTGAERGFLMLMDEESGELDVVVARNIRRETVEEASFEISHSIVRSVAELGQPVVTTNAQADPRFASQESVISYNLRSILCVPLQIKENVIGVIYADNRITTGIFNEDDRDLLTAFANQAAVAIENARLFRQIRDQLAHITEMTNLMNDVFDSIASGVITIDQANLISLYNQAAERILGIPGHQVLEQHYKSVLEPLSDAVEDVVEDIKVNGGQKRIEVDVTLERRPATASLSMIFSPLRDVQQKPLGVTVVLDDLSEKKRLESVRRYLPPMLVDRIRDLDAAQRPQRQRLSIVFADVRGFSSFSEQLAPEQLVEIINQYFTAAAREISRYEGLIDKFMGDAVMALFNTPLNPQEDHAERAARTALAIQQAIADLHEQLPSDNCLFMGIGVHTGEAVVGNVGSRLRKDYSALGDAVNLAKRLQESSGPNQILISEDVYQTIQPWAKVEKLEPMRVKGRQALEQLYALLGSVQPEE